MGRRGQTAWIPDENNELGGGGSRRGKGENEADVDVILGCVRRRKHLNGVGCVDEMVFLRRRRETACNTSSGSVPVLQPLARRRGDRCLGVWKLLGSSHW